MLVSTIILVISFILDGLLTNYLPYGVGNLSLFTPLTTIVALIIIYMFFYKNEKTYFVISFITGFMYDLFYTNLLFLDAILFLLIAFIVSQVYKIVDFKFIWVLIGMVLVIVIYEVAFATIITVFNLVPMSFERIIYKISHSIILNVIYGEILYLICKLLPKKYKKVMIN